MRRSRWMRSSWSPPASFGVGEPLPLARGAPATAAAAVPSEQNGSRLEERVAGGIDPAPTLNHRSRNASTAAPAVSLMEAVGRGDTGALRAALAERAQRSCPRGTRDPINSPQPRTGYTPLHLAARSGDVTLVGMLLSAGAYQNVGDADGLTPLHHAVKLEYEAVAAVLLRANANPNHLSHAHYTPVHFACKLGSVPLVRALLMSRGKKDIKTKDTHSTPLHLAVLTRNQAVLEVLLGTGDSNFDINVTDSYGYTPLHRASQMGLPEMVRLLVNYGASKSFRGRWDWTALHWAASCGHADVVRVLLELGALQGIEDNDGNIAFDVAIDESVRKLLDPSVRRITARDGLHERPSSRQPSITNMQCNRSESVVLRERGNQDTSSSESTPRHDASLKVLPSSPLSKGLGTQSNWRHRPITPWMHGLRQSQEVKFHGGQRTEHSSNPKAASGALGVDAQHSAKCTLSPLKPRQRAAGPHSPGALGLLASRLDINVSSSSSSSEEEGEGGWVTGVGGRWHRALRDADSKRETLQERRLSSSMSSSSGSSSSDDDGTQSTRAYSWTTQPYSPVTPARMAGGSQRLSSPWSRSATSSPNVMRHSFDLCSPNARESKVRHFCARSRLHALLLHVKGWRGEQGLRLGLQELGFQTFSSDSDSPGDFTKAVRRLCEGLLPGDAAVLVYAGPSILVGDNRYLVPGAVSTDGADTVARPKFHGVQLERLSRQLSARCASVASAIVGDCSHVLEASSVMVVAIGKGSMSLSPADLCSRVVNLFANSRQFGQRANSWGDE